MFVGLHLFTGHASRPPTARWGDAGAWVLRRVTLAPAEAVTDRGHGVDELGDEEFKVRPGAVLVALAGHLLQLGVGVRVPLGRLRQAFRGQAVEEVGE